MDTHDRGAGKRGDDARRKRSREPVRIVAAGRLADEGFARGTDEDRIAERGQLREPVEKLEVLLRRLAESETRVERDAILANAGASGDVERALEIGAANRDRVARQRLGGAKNAGIVHGDHPGAEVRRDRRHVFVALQPADVVDDRRARAERRLGDRRLHRVDGDRHAGRGRRLDDGEDALHLLDRRDPGCALAGRFAADVEDMRAFARQPHRVLHGRCGLAEAPAVIEGIRASRSRCP